jgi:hypothetical protein
MRNNRAAIALLCGLTLLQAQQPAQQPPAAAGDTLPKFTSNTQLVVEIVSVKDKDGKVIEGLTAKDFVITENGVPQTISFCEFQRLDEKIEPVAAPPVASPATPTPPPAEKPKADPTAEPATSSTATAASWSFTST